MTDYYLYSRRLCLILLLVYAAGMKAQSYLQFWFDSDKTLKQTAISTSGTVKGKINVQNLSQGLHTIFMRVKSSDTQYAYSPVSSTTFLKFITSETSSALEYWFDDNFDSISSIPIDMPSDKMRVMTLDMSDEERFPVGIHQINMRVVNNGGIYSPVYSSLVLRVPSGTGDPKLEYWFDDEVSKSATLPLAMETTEVQKFDIDLGDINDLPLGIHKLSMRVARGNQYSPVYSAPVLRLRAGVNNKLTYWLDDDYANRRNVFTTELSADGAYFKTKLDMSTVSPGMHRFHFCVSNKDAESGTVYEMPILVTRRYNNQTDVTIVNHSYWLNDAEVASYAVANPKSLFVQTYNLDPANYEVGQYAFHVQYKNSAEVWSEQNITYFYKEAETGRLRVGMMPDNATNIYEATQPDEFHCNYYGGTIYVDCQSPKLASTGVILICDLTGKVFARQVVNNANGIHAEINVGSHTSQLLIVKVLSGGVNFTQKLVCR